MISEGEDYARINVVPTNFAPTFSLFQPVNDQHDAKGNCLERCDYDQITNDILENDYGIIETRGEKFEVRNMFCLNRERRKNRKQERFGERSVEYRSNICQLLREALCLTSTLDSQRYFATNTDAGG